MEGQMKIPTVGDNIKQAKVLVKRSQSCVGQLDLTSTIILLNQLSGLLDDTEKMAFELEKK